MSKYAPFDLNDDQLKMFGKIHRNKYGSSGAFLGLCFKTSTESALPFEQVLKSLLDEQIRAILTEEHLTKKEGEWKNAKAKTKTKRKF